MKEVNLNKRKVKLFHLSEKNNIKTFIPRTSKPIWNHKKYVWAISENMVHHYLFPRDCPRIGISSKVALDLGLNEKEIMDTKAYVFIPERWVEKFKSCILFKYEFNPNRFVEIDAIAGYYVSQFVEEPIEVMEVNNCPKLLASMKVRVLYRSDEALEQIKREVVDATNNFSIIRWSNLAIKNRLD